MEKRIALMLALGWLLVTCASAQFLDDFNGSSLKIDRRGIDGWTFFTGDGTATMSFTTSGKGYASISVDATSDTLGIWWALVKRCVSHHMNLSLLHQQHHGIRVEASIRSSEAPRRVNLSLNTQRTTDFHKDLMEFDIPDTVHWHTISMTLNNFNAVPGDTMYAQLALMDWGLERYRIDVDYFRVDIVDTDSAGLDKGVQVPYQPRIANVNSFHQHLKVAADATIDREYPDMNFNNWIAHQDSIKVVLLTVNSTQRVILRWDVGAYQGKKVVGSGLLELTTYALQRAPEYSKDFGMVRITEILGGTPQWNQKDVSYRSFCQDQPIDHVLNSQMIIDVEVQPLCGSKNYITISNPVLRRMIDGKTLGIAIKPLGAIVASFYSMENANGEMSPTLHFNIESDMK